MAGTVVGNEGKAVQGTVAPSRQMSCARVHSYEAPGDGVSRGVLAVSTVITGSPGYTGNAYTHVCPFKRLLRNESFFS